MFNFVRAGFLIGCILMISGCGTIMSGTSQAINIKVTDVNTQQILEGVRCTVSDGAGGTYALLSNPGSVKVSRSGGAIQVNCRKDNYRQLNTAVGDSFNGATIVNILFWPGFIVDAMSGAYKKFPTHYVVTMEKIN